MIRKKLYKKSKPIVALTAIAAMLITGVTPVRATVNSNTDFAPNAVQQSAQKYRNVMYYGDWSIWGGQGNFYPKDIPADQLTHLNFAFVDFDAQGVLKFTDKDAATGHPLGNAGVTYGDVNGGILNAFQVLKSENPNLKIGVSLGGWSKSGDFSVIAANPSIRANFVKNVMAFIKYTNMDFVDIDWEYPASLRDPDKVDNTNDEGTTKATPADKENFIILLQDLKNALNKQGTELGKTYELSVAIPAGKTKVDEGIDVAKLFNVVDFANIMTYDMAGAWSTVSGHQTALYTNPKSPFKGECLSVDESVNYYIANGAKPEKIVIGAAYYTRGWEKVSNNGPDAANPGLFGTAAVVNKDADLSPTPGALNEAPIKNGEGGRAGGVWSYNALSQLKSKYTGLKEYWDDSAKAPYLYNETTGAFFTYDNARSIQEKAKYVKEHNLGGMIAWMASQDAKTTSTKHDELTKVTKEALFGSGSLDNYTLTYNNLNITSKLTTSKPAWGSGSVINLSFTNNEKLSESGEVLSSVETAAKTLKNVKLYIKTNGITITGAQHPSPAVKQENGYYVIDFSVSYDGKLMKPGQTISFDLNIAESIDNLNGLVSVELSQRMYSTSPEMGRQFIYGSPVSPDDNTAPVINGATNKQIYIGDSFNPLSGITASDKEDGDLTSKITVSGTVDTTKAGSYNLTYSVVDSKGLKATTIVTITVSEKTSTNTAPVINGVTNKEIKIGSAFNPLTGITASDNEDGDLTNKIVVSGTVDTTKAGAYNLTYSVTDSKGLVTTAKATITVVNDTTPEIPTYSPTKAYVAGDIVMYNGVKYKAKWWTQGETPGANQWGAWEKIN
ncbi:MAG: glycosyl hydrolase family 18 protein [Clostridium sp.]|uniref:glycosyl hydrolase family 18 protein n=1 Tax=Clostridium sp. TaxID=1506 RepID=UPI0029019D5F|nr:glycosyl hydrolase family 18 protein [Clostridium sp.]MDU2683256.1 glycosyl hydrolase family 18 protein [Clostridium sp.]